MWLAYKNGDLLIAPDEIDPQLASDLGSVTPELVVEDEFGWTIHLPGEIVRYDSCWEEPYALMSYALWAQYEDLLDDVRNPDG
jgi:hypothetical protein